MTVLDHDSEDLLRALREDGEPMWRTAEDAAFLLQVRVRTFRMWARRGHIQAVDGKYDLRAVARWYYLHRDTRMDDVRRGVALKTTAV